MICKVQVEKSLVSALCIIETPLLSKAAPKILNTVNDLVRISVKKNYTNLGAISNIHVIFFKNLKPRDQYFIRLGHVSPFLNMICSHKAFSCSSESVSLVLLWIIYLLRASQTQDLNFKGSKTSKWGFEGWLLQPWIFKKILKSLSICIMYYCTHYMVSLWDSIHHGFWLFYSSWCFLLSQGTKVIDESHDQDTTDLDKCILFIRDSTLNQESCRVSCHFNSFSTGKKLWMFLQRIFTFFASFFIIC